MSYTVKACSCVLGFVLLANSSITSNENLDDVEVPHEGGEHEACLAPRPGRFIVRLRELRPHRQVHVKPWTTCNYELDELVSVSKETGEVYGLQAQHPAMVI